MERVRSPVGFCGNIICPVAQVLGRVVFRCRHPFSLTYPGPVRERGVGLNGVVVFRLAQMIGRMQLRCPAGKSQMHNALYQG